MVWTARWWSCVFIRRLWFVEIRTAYLLVFRLSAAHIRSVTTDASVLPTASVRQRSVQIYHGSGWFNSCGLRVQECHHASCNRVGSHRWSALQSAQYEIQIGKLQESTGASCTNGWMLCSHAFSKANSGGIRRRRPEQSYVTHRDSCEYPSPLDQCPEPLT